MAHAVTEIIQFTKNKGVVLSPAAAPVTGLRCLCLQSRLAAQVAPVMAFCVRFMGEADPFHHQDNQYVTDNGHHRG
jgi:hypothetical protein